MPLKIGDRVMVTGSMGELVQYDADSLFGHKGKVTDTRRLSVESLADWAKKIPGIKPDTLLYFIKPDNRIDSYWVFDMHVELDIDSLPYDEWVRRRDWNKVYKQQSEKLLSEIRK